MSECVRVRRRLDALDDEGKPDFTRVCEAVLHRHSGISLTFVAFDVLSVEGRDLTREPYSARRRTLEQMQLAGPHWHTPEAFDDGAALWDAVCEHDVEGVVAKRRSSRYTPRERGWVKTKNRAYWRYELEREGSIRSRSKLLYRTAFEPISSKSATAKDLFTAQVTETPSIASEVNVTFSFVPSQVSFTIAVRTCVVSTAGARTAPPLDWPNNYGRSSITGPEVPCGR